MILKYPGARYSNCLYHKLKKAHAERNFPTVTINNRLIKVNIRSVLCISRINVEPNKTNK